MLKFKSIAVPTDFSDHSLRALPYAVSFAERFGARLRIIYVYEPSLQVSDVAWVGVDAHALEEEHGTEARRTLDRILAEQIPDGLEADAEVITGEPVEEIVRFARDEGIDLIVMATHGRGGLSHVLMGSVAGQIVRKAPCPVLTLKHPMTFRADVPDSDD